MSFIDLSDPEEMFGLLLDVVADEARASRGDPDRRRALSDLSRELRALEAQLSTIPPSTVIERLRGALESVGSEFSADPAVTHLRHCIEEMERVEHEGV